MNWVLYELRHDQKKRAVTLDGVGHNFRFEQQFRTGRKEYCVDDQLVRKIGGGLIASSSFGDKAPFSLGSHTGLFESSAKAPLKNAIHPGSIFCEHNGIVSKCGLSIDGNNIQGAAEKTLHYPQWLNRAFIIFIVILVFAVQK